jgi:hypothetical protein
MNPKRAAAAAAAFAAVLAVLVGTRIFAQGEGAGYAGPKRCKKCHLKEHKGMEGEGHAHAFSVLKEEDWGRTDERTKKACLACHTTGYGRPTGFVSAAATPELAGVSCEACHGPGSVHAGREKTENERIKAAGGDLGIRRSDGGACLFCHNPHVRFVPAGEKK